MAKNMIGAIVGGIGALAQTLINKRTQDQNVNKTIKAQKEAAQLEWERNLQMWDKQNAFNAPEAQMERLRQAGLNPNMVYGSGSAANQAAQMPKYNAPRPEYNYAAPDFMSALSAYQDFAMKQAQTDNLRAQNAVIDANAKLKAKEAQVWTEPEWYGDPTTGEVTRESPYNRRAKMQMQKLELENQLKSGMMPYQLEYASGRNKKLTNEMAKMQGEIEYNSLRNRWYSTKMISDMANQAFRTIGGMIPSNVGKKAAGNITRQPGQYINPKTRTPGYNSTESWRQMGY